MAVSWTKLWGPSDDGTVIRGVDLRNIQEDINTTGLADADAIQGVPVVAPTAADDGKALIYDETTAQFIYGSLTGIEPGITVQWAGSTAPSGWEICDGRALDRTTFATLFTNIGTTFGVGDGSTTFNIPDLRGRFPLGADNMGGVSADRVTATEADTVGDSSGDEFKNVSHDHTGTTGGHSLVEGELPSHTHESAVETGGGVGSAKVNADSDGAGTPINTGSTGSGTAHDHTISTDGSATQDVMNPYLTMNYIIKTT
jgi:microcystin-dependent protein